MENILQYQQALQILKDQLELENLKENRPTAVKDQLTYEESITFGKKVERYESDLNHIGFQVKNLKRELTAFEHQKQSLLPVTVVKGKAFKYSNEEVPTNTFCMQCLEERPGQAEEKFKIERL